MKTASVSHRRTTSSSGRASHCQRYCATQTTDCGRSLCRITASTLGRHGKLLCLVKRQEFADLTFFTFTNYSHVTPDVVGYTGRRSSEDSDWPVHCLMSSVCDLRGLSLRRPFSSVTVVWPFESSVMTFQSPSIQRFDLSATV